MHKSIPWLILCAGIGFLVGYLAVSQWQENQPVVQPPESTPQPIATADDPGEGRTVLVWISIDGLRPDYLDRGNTPFFDQLREEGAFTDRLIPIFPSLTFPSHVSQATGVKVAQHGIPLNRFLDRETGEIHSFPGDSTLLQAEPIWITAQRQGIRTAVLDWPLSHSQKGEVRTDYHGVAYDGSLTDAERLHRLAEVWQNDPADPPLGLLMGYMVGTDKPGHAYGPDAPEMTPAIEEADAIAMEFFENIRERFEEIRQPDDRLIFIITTDHGMGPVDHLVNLEALAGIRFPEEVQMVTGGNVAHLHFHQVDPERAEAMMQSIETRLAEVEFLAVHRRDQMPAEWDYGHPGRVGELVVVLDPGYTFSSRQPEPLFSPEAAGGPLGMHGYWVEEDENMLGVAFFWSSDGRWEGLEVDEVHSLELHATVAELLGIEPADGARRDTVTELLEAVSTNP